MKFSGLVRVEQTGNTETGQEVQHPYLILGTDAGRN